MNFGQNFLFQALDDLTKPSNKWGPHDKEDKEAKKYFYPQREEKYRNPEMKCSHNCVISSSKFHQEQIIQTRKMQTLIHLIKSTHGETFPVLESTLENQ